MKINKSVKKVRYLIDTSKYEFKNFRFGLRRIINY